MIDEVLEDNYKMRVTYTDDGKQIGYVLVEDAIDIINIVDVSVLEDYRRMGIASKLFNYVFDFYKDRCVKYMLEVRVDNIPAINLYKKLGFSVIHVREKYYKGTDAFIMEFGGF